MNTVYPAELRQRIKEGHAARHGDTYFKPSTPRSRGRQTYVQFEASLVFIMSSRTARAACATMSPNIKNKTKKRDRHDCLQSMYHGLSLH